MKIQAIDVRPLRIRRRERFVTARHASDETTVFVVRVRSEGLEGFGGGTPSEEVTGETTAATTTALRLLARQLPGEEAMDLARINEVMKRIAPSAPAARAAVDIALYDLLGKRKGLPLYRLLGGTRDRMPTDITLSLGDTEETVARARRAAADGFRALKVKVAGTPEASVERVRAVREAVGPSVSLRVDANQDFSPNAALRFATEAAAIGIEFLEQPVPAADLKGLAEVTARSPIPIMADEAVRTWQDADALTRQKAAHLVNLKLMKFGGITEAIGIHSLCRDAGIGAMVGCFGESQLSIAAGLHFALARGVEYADLDSHFNLEADPAAGISMERGNLVVGDGPGLGLRVDDSVFQR